MKYEAGKKAVSFGQRVLGYTTRRNESFGGGGGRGLGIRWGHRWAPPQGTTTKIHLLPGSYTDFEGNDTEYFPYVEHFVKRSNQGFICSRQYQIVDGELTAVGGKCLGCREREAGADDISFSLKHAFNVLHLAHYHEVPAEDKNGKPILHKKGKNAGKPAMNRLICEGRKCPHCKEGHEKVFGKHVHWSLGSGHMNELTGAVTEIEKDCANCKEGRLSIATYECEKCAHPIIDMATTEMELKSINSYVARARECPECKHKAIPMPQLECNNCQDPSPLSIFDCELEIKRQGEGTNSTVQIPRWTMAEVPEELKEMCKPFEFKGVFTADPFEFQAKVLKIKNPWASEDADKHSKGYGKGEEPEEPEEPAEEPAY